MQLYTHTHTDNSSEIKILADNKIQINNIYNKSYASKNYKIAGITLIALVTTIVILIILAGISIGTLKNSSLFGKAKKATSDYTNSEKKEKNMLNDYESQIAKEEENKNYVNPYKGKIWCFDYTGGEQEFEIPADGIYKLETWGAQGGSYSKTSHGGYGGYAVGNIRLNKEEKLYINIGGKGLGDGTHQFRAGGYNGGGDAQTNGDWHTRQSSGGGATHISTRSGVLSSLKEFTNSILIVSGGGRRRIW